MAVMATLLEMLPFTKSLVVTVVEWWPLLVTLVERWSLGIVIQSRVLIILIKRWSLLLVILVILVIKVL